ncbi:MAG TPA: terminase small subunit, partial [Phycisphaerae bacterium]
SVAAEIARRTEAYTRAAGIDAVWVLERMKNIADADLSRVFDDKGALIPPRLWPDDLKRCIASVKVVELAGGMEIGGEAGIKHVPMFTKEVKLEARVPVLAKLLDWIDAKPTPPAQRRFAADWIRTSE